MVSGGMGPHVALGTVSVPHRASPGSEPLGLPVGHRAGPAVLSDGPCVLMTQGHLGPLLVPLPAAGPGLHAKAPQLGVTAEQLGWRGCWPPPGQVIGALGSPSPGPTALAAPLAQVCCLREPIRVELLTPGRSASRVTLMPPCDGEEAGSAASGSPCP